ncbi:hypothetical protein Tco_0740019 [Tanacetum coccineum]
MVLLKLYPVVKPVHTYAPSLPPGHSLGSSEHSSRYLLFDLANTMSSSSEMEDIHHHPDTGIFSSSSYDDDFGGTVTNLAPSIVVDSVPTKRVNIIHPQSQILRDLTSPVQTRGTITQIFYIVCLLVLSNLTSSVAQVFNDPAWVGSYARGDGKQFINQKYGKLVLYHDGENCYGDKMDYKNKRDDQRLPHVFAASRADIQFAVNVLVIETGLWYPRDSPFVLEAYSDSDYAGSHGDRKSTTGGCQFLGRRLISWQCKKQTIVATSSTEAEYVAAANCCGQALLDLGDHMPLLGTMLPPAQAAIAGESSGEAAPSNPQTVPETITEPDHSHGS